MLNNCIFIRDFRCDAWIGVYDWEQAGPQTLELSIEYGLPSNTAGQTDKLTDTIDYGRVVEQVRTTLAVEKFKLMEALVERIAHIVMVDLGAPWVRISAAKINHVKGVGRLGVTITRGIQP